MASGGLRLQLLGFFLDLLAVALDLLDLALQLFHPQFVLHLALLVLHHAQLVAGIPSPVEHRAQVARFVCHLTIPLWLPFNIC